MVRGPELFLEWVDELAAQRCQELTVRAEQEAMLAETAKRALTPPAPDDTPLTIRWACLKPTDPPTRVLYEGQYTVVKQGVDPGFGDLLRIWQEKR